MAEKQEFPKWLHKGWKATEKPGHFESAESRLVTTQEAAKALVAKGWTEAPPEAAPAKKE